MASIAELDKTKAQLRAKIQDYIRLRLGDQMVDVELDPEHYTNAIDNALLRYRQRSQNSTQESYAFLDLLENTSTYQLSTDIINVRQIFRRGLGTTTGGTAGSFEPFSSGYLNQYMLVQGRVGGLLSYELFQQYQELTMTMFGGYMNFTWNPVTHVLDIVRNLPGPTGSTEVIESVLLWCDNYKPEISILSNHMTFPWIQEFALAIAMISLGNAREKFSAIAGPQGGGSLNGAVLKTEAKEIMEKLEEELKRYIDGGQPLGFIYG